MISYGGRQFLELIQTRDVMGIIIKMERDIWEMIKTLVGGSKIARVKLNCVGNLWGMLEIKDSMIEFEVPH